MTAVFPGLTPMVPNTAAAFVLLGASLWALQSSRADRCERWGRLAAFAALGLAVAAIAERILGFPQVEHLLPVARHDGARMAAATAVNIALLAAGLLTLQRRTRSGWGPAHLAGAFVWCSALYSLAMHLYSTPGLFERSGPLAPVALNTALGLAVLSAAVVGARDCDCALAVLGSRGTPGTVARRLLILAAALPAALDLLVAAAAHLGLIAFPSSGAAHSALLTLSLSLAALVVANSLQRERRRENARLLLAAAVEQSSNVVIITDLAGNIEYVNPKFASITGWSAEEAMGRNPRFLKSGDIPPEGYRAFWAALLRGETWQGEVRNKRKDGTFYLASVTAFAVRDSDGRISHLVAIQEDVTARKALEQEVFHAHKMEVLGRMAGSFAHDFNNLLTAMGGYCEFALGQLPEGAPARNDVLEIRATAKRASELARHMLTFSRRDVVRRKHVDLIAFLSELQRLLQQLLGPRIRLELSPGRGPLIVRMDPVQLEQVIVNLTVNARDAITGDGTVRIEATRVAGAGGELARIRVSDDGKGMDAETLSHLFEPFFTTKQPGQGTGLGLSTCFGIVRQSGGTIAAESAPGRGTTITFDLPLAPPEPERTQPPAPTKAERSSERVLIVDDDPSVLRMALRALETAGLRALGAASGAEALSLLRGPEPVHLLLTDVRMPHMTGIELARRAREVAPSLPVIYMSGFTGEVLEAGMDPEVNFLSKPFAPDVLVERVRRALSAGPGAR
ncbi:MAG: PAS domain S-box protein [Elusimicrobia bacterium]|nr:PAS domain S-box protein [Elusimicrobiota bacterium]